MTPSHAPLDAHARLRLFVFVLVLAAMVAVPLASLWSNDPVAQHVGWRMFSETATDICVVRYERHRDSHPPETLDRFAVLGYATADAAPLTLFRITTAEDAHFYARELCAALGGDSDVRMHLSCATDEGYDVVARGERNLCP